MSEPKETIPTDGYKKTVGGGDANKPGPMEIDTNPGKKQQISSQPTKVAGSQ